MSTPILQPVEAEVTGYVTYPGPSGPINSALPGPCGTHRYFASVMTNDGPLQNFIIYGSVLPCYQPPTLHVIPLAIGSGIHGVRLNEGVGNASYRWYYRELPLVGPCNPGGG